MRYSRRGPSAEDKKGFLIAGAGVAILIALALFALRVMNAPEKDFDRVTLCNDNIPRRSHHLLIVDVSDVLSPHQAHFLRTHISGLLQQAEVNDRLSLFVLDEKYNGLSDPLVDLCKPRSGDQVDSLTANRHFVEQLYRERFRVPLDKAIAAAVSADDLSVSPIYEALSDLASLNRIDPRAEQVDLTIVSDMIQNSKAGSVFSSGPGAIAALPAIDLRRVRTRVFWLDRDKYRKYQTPELRERWEDYLASVSRFERIEEVRD